MLDSISELGVRMIDADGRTSAGKPYLDLVDADGDGILAPGERTRSRRVNFDNPARLRFRFASRIADIEEATVVAAVPPPRRERVHRTWHAGSATGRAGNRDAAGHRRAWRV